jgi:hypothetical protein
VLSTLQTLSVPALTQSKQQYRAEGNGRYPIHNAIVKAKRKKLAPEIIRLADELME